MFKYVRLFCIAFSVVRFRACVHQSVFFPSWKRSAGSAWKRFGGAAFFFSWDAFGCIWLLWYGISAEVNMSAQGRALALGDGKAEARRGGGQTCRIIQVHEILRARKHLSECDHSVQMGFSLGSTLLTHTGKFVWSSAPDTRTTWSPQ